MRRSSNTRGWALGLALIAASPAALSQEAPDGRFDALALIQLGEYERACMILDETYPGLSNDPDITFMRGQCLAGQGEFAAARTQFRHVLALDPNAARAHLEIAATYQVEGRLRDARLAYSEILSTNPPPGVERNVEFAMARLEAAQPWYVEGRFGLAYDTNINSGPSDSEIFAFGLPFTLSDGSLENQSEAYSLGLEGGYRWKVSDDTQLSLRGSASHTDYHEGSEYDSQTFAVSFGPTVQRGKFQVALLPAIGFQMLDYDGYRMTGGADGRISYRAHPDLQVNLSSGIKAQDYRASEGRDGWRAYTAASALVKADWGVTTIGYVGTREDTDDDTKSSNSHAARFGLSRKLGPAHLSANYQFTSKEYDALEPGYFVLRQDDTHDASAALQFPLDSTGLSTRHLELSYGFTDNASNVDLYTFDRHRISLMIAQRW